MVPAIYRRLLALVAVLLLLSFSARAAPSAAPSASIDNPRDGCSSEPKPIACSSGQTSYYVPQSSVACAHYICITRPADGGNSDDPSTKSTKSVVLPAVLGSVLSAIAIGFGILYYIIRRNRASRAVDAQHQDAKYMSGYNNLGDDSFGANPMSPGAYSSTYSVSKWCDSAFPTPGGPHSHTSIPIIFSQENSAEFMHGSRETKLYNGALEPAFRETRLYPATAPTDEARQWAAPNVVNVKQKPQLVVLDNSMSSLASGDGLEVSAANIRSSQSTSSDSGSGTGSDTGSDSGSDTCSDTDSDVESDSGSASPLGPGSPTTPLTPDTPDVSKITQALTPMTTQMPRIVQVGHPLMIRSLEPSQKQAQPSLSSPLHVQSNGWDSESDSDDDGEEAENARDVESDVESDDEDNSTPHVPDDPAPNADAESEYSSEYDSEYESEYSSEGESGAETDEENDNDNDSKANTPAPNPPADTGPHLMPLEEQPSLGSELKFETTDDGSFFAEVLKATADIDAAHTNSKP
ncbi:hypothetical protein GGI06_000839 [Coemansia sp. S85]|nr:hypothetical protein GGI06_000839 [Coemansia sp. S85]